MNFSEFKYEHLDYEDMKNQYVQLIEKLKGCDNPDDFMKVFKEINIFRGHKSSMGTICSIRHTINTADEFYDKENSYWDETVPLLEEYEVEFSKTVLTCPFRDKLDIPKTFDLYAQYAMKSFSPEIIQDLQEENRLITEYGKLKASAKIEFNG